MEQLTITGLMYMQITNCLYAHTVNCGDPGTPSNGYTMVTVTTFGSIVSHNCDVGYALIGANERECLANGSWSAPLPSCQSKQPRYSYSCICNFTPLCNTQH